MFIVFFYIDVHSCLGQTTKGNKQKKTKKSTRLASNRKGNNAVHTRSPHKALYEKIKTEAVKNAKKNERNERKNHLMRTKRVNKYCPLVVIPDVSVM